MFFLILQAAAKFSAFFYLCCCFHLPGSFLKQQLNLKKHNSDHAQKEGPGLHGLLRLLWGGWSEWGSAEGPASPTGRCSARVRDGNLQWKCLPSRSAVKLGKLSLGSRSFTLPLHVVQQQGIVLLGGVDLWPLNLMSYVWLWRMRCSAQPVVYTVVSLLCLVNITFLPEQPSRMRY